MDVDEWDIPCFGVLFLVFVAGDSVNGGASEGGTRQEFSFSSTSSLSESERLLTPFFLALAVARRFLGSDEEV